MRARWFINEAGALFLIPGQRTQERAHDDKLDLLGSDKLHRREKIGQTFPLRESTRKKDPHRSPARLLFSRLGRVKGR